METVFVEPGMAAYVEVNANLGLQIFIQDRSIHGVRMVVQAAQPAADADNYVRIASHITVNDTKGNKVWLRGDTGTAKCAVVRETA